MSKPKPLASLSLDLDNKWSYMKAQGLSGWQHDEGYLDSIVPVILETLARHDLKITFFIVGHDAADRRNGSALRSLADAGHDIANHSFDHDPRIASLSRDLARAELRHAHDAISEATGVEPTGFRAPSYALSVSLLKAVADLGYAYDASTLPSVVGPLARLYHFATSKMSKQLREERKHVFGSFSDGFRPLRPYQWKLDDHTLLEIPVTTFPGFRVPIHMTYLTFLAARSQAVALSYFQAALAACRVNAIAPSILLHPLDFVGVDRLPILGGFPGMRLKTSEKLAFVDRALGAMSSAFSVTTMDEHARSSLQAGGGLSRRVPRFAVDAS